MVSGVLKGAGLPSLPGSGGLRPHRAKAAERSLTARRLDEDVAREAGHAALDGVVALARNSYKLRLFEALVRRAILMVVEKHDG